MTRALCRHCKRKPVNRPRGLCWSCYYRPGVLALYPSTSKYARRSTPDTHGPRPLPSGPTDAGPGTPAKVRVLAERAGGRHTLWHPDDNAEPRAAEPGRLCDGYHHGMED